MLNEFSHPSPFKVSYARLFAGGAHRSAPPPCRANGGRQRDGELWPVERPRVGMRRFLRDFWNFLFFV